MAFWDFLTGKKKKTKPIRSATVKSEKKTKKRAKVEKAAEEPIFTVSRQLTNLERDLENINTVLHSGFRGLREDHHKILGEQAKKADLENFKKYLEARKSELERIREGIEREMVMLDIDKKILSLIERKKQRAVDVKKELRISRQYAAMRLSKLVKYGAVEQVKKGREVYYMLRK